MATITTICGSTKFKEAFIEANKKLTLEGKIVLTVGFFEHAQGIALTEEQFELLKALHFEKIRMSDEIFVVNVNGYIGNSTQIEIAYAKDLGKKIMYLEEIGSGSLA